MMKSCNHNCSDGPTWFCLGVGEVIEVETKDELVLGVSWGVQDQALLQQTLKREPRPDMTINTQRELISTLTNTQRELINQHTKGAHQHINQHTKRAQHINQHTKGARQHTKGAHQHINQHTKRAQHINQHTKGAHQQRELINTLINTQRELINTLINTWTMSHTQQRPESPATSLTCWMPSKVHTYIN